MMLPERAAATVPYVLIDTKLRTASYQPDCDELCCNMYSINVDCSLQFAAACKHPNQSK